MTYTVTTVVDSPWYDPSQPVNKATNNPKMTKNAGTCATRLEAKRLLAETEGTDKQIWEDR